MIVVTDTSVILNLCLIQRAELLPQLFGKIICPPSVRAEFERLAKYDPRFAGLFFPEFIEVKPVGKIQPELGANHRIHPGEIEAISLALESNAQALLIDERAGRQAAAALGLQCIGILGILLQAKSKRLIESVSPLIAQLESQGQFWMAPGLVKRILELAGET
ncbi:DUF3368 domain-containing protein [Akkermansiaceae bacterium]|nr:DUF3368 domain-containing protein [Akkermansiaceae bacterium]